MSRFLRPIPPPKPLNEPPGSGRVLVVAPHPDDETIGPGGTLALHADAGDSIHCVFLTAGLSGDPTGKEDPAEYGATRQAEARHAAAVIGIGELEFWGYPDNHVISEADVAGLVPRVVKLLERIRPDVVYGPHLADQHSDHYTAAVLIKRALAAVENPPPAFGYEVWSAGSASHVIDVSSVYDRKREAIRCYPSQLQHTDIERFISGLNAHRAAFLEKGARYGEGFLAVTPDAHVGFDAEEGD